MSKSRPTVCSVDNCTRLSDRYGPICNAHYLRMRRHGSYDLPLRQYQKPCSIDGCDRMCKAKDLCQMHLDRLRANGSPHVVKIRHEHHGMHGHPLYKTWANMKSRCYNPDIPNYQNYGARGIQVCDRWRNSFSAFVADVGERPDGCTLDRIDPNGDYEPGNVRWASASVQVKNTNTRRDNTSGHKGVSWDGNRKLWRAFKGGGRSRVELGYFTDFEEAVSVRHEATVDDPAIRCCEVLDAIRRGEAA